jgi:hypothetical protein
MVWTTNVHDVRVVADQTLVGVMGLKSGGDHRDVAVGSHVVVPEEPLGMCNAQVVVREAGKEGI